MQVMTVEFARHVLGMEDANSTEFDLSTQKDCDLIVEKFEPRILINTVAVNQTHNPWDILTVNFTSVAYLTLKFYEKMSQGQIINISSTSTLWTSYPGIDTGRFCYNLSKENLSLFGKHFNRKIVDETKPFVLSTLEIGKFASKFNNFQSGMPIDEIIKIVDSVVHRPVQQVTVIR
jgi:hypothetical protein